MDHIWTLSTLMSFGWFFFSGRLMFDVSMIPPSARCMYYRTSERLGSMGHAYQTSIFNSHGSYLTGVSM